MRKIQYTVKHYPELGKTELIPSGGLCWAVKVSREHSHQVFREDCFKSAGAYLLLADTDDGRREVYVGESHIVKGRFASHQGKNPPVKWDDAIVFLNNTRLPWSKNEINNIQLGLYEKLVAVNRYKMPPNVQHPNRWSVPDQDLIDRLVEEMIAMTSFLGYPKLFVHSCVTGKEEVGDRLTRRHGDTERKGTGDVEGEKTARGKKRPAPGFAFGMAHVPDGAELVFTEGGQKVRARGKNQVEYQGVVYSLTGFVKKFMPSHKRNKADAYQGPAFFTFQGELLTKRRKKFEEPALRVSAPPCETNKEGNDFTWSHGDTEGKKEVCVSGQNKTQLAKSIALKVDGKVGAFGGILQYFSRFKHCPPTGKWRKPLADVGIHFDKDDLVIDWRAAKLED